MPRKPTTFVCEVCGQQFTRPEKEQRCCSLECAAVLRRGGRKKPDYICESCGVRFIPNHTYQRFCTKKCAGGFLRHGRKAWSDEERIFHFWQRVDKTSQCWVWTGTIDLKGYGMFCRKRAHRYSWELHFGPIPSGLSVCHHCDNPACIRPDHLFLGTTKDNMDDRNSKHRQAHGERNAGAKLTESEVRAIRASFTGRYGERIALARQFGVSKSAINAVLSRKTWKLI